MSTATPPVKNIKRFDLDFNGPGNLRHAHSETPYVILSKNLKQHINAESTPGEDFSLFTLGLYTFIRMLPPDWEFTMRGLMQVLPHGRDKLTKEVSILEKYGYLIRVQNKEKTGQFNNDFLWVTVDDNSDYKDLIEYMKSLGYYVYEKANVENLSKKPQVGTDALKTRASVANGENAKTGGNNEQYDVENQESPGETDSLKNRLSVFETEINNRIESTNKDNLTSNDARATTKRAEPEGSLRSSQYQSENSTEKNYRVDTAHPQTQETKNNEPSPIENAPISDGVSITGSVAKPEKPMTPEIAVIKTIVTNSPNQEGLDSKTGKRRIMNAYNKLLETGRPCEEIEKAWWETLRVYAYQKTPSNEFPSIAAWLEAGGAAQVIETGEILNSENSTASRKTEQELSVSASRNDEAA